MVSRTIISENTIPGGKSNCDQLLFLLILIVTIGKHVPGRFLRVP